MVHDEETNKNWVVLMQKTLSLLLGSVLIVILMLLVLVCIEMQVKKGGDKGATMRGSQINKIMMDGVDDDASLGNLNAGGDNEGEYNYDDDD